MKKTFKIMFGILLVLIMIPLVSAVNLNCNGLLCTQSMVFADIPFNITLASSAQGVYQYAWIYRDGTIYGNRVRLCDNGRCKNQVGIEHLMPDSWPTGSYSIRFYDYNGPEWKFLDFSFLSAVDAVAINVIFDPYSYYIIKGQTLGIYISPGTEGIRKDVYIRDSSNTNIYQTSFDCITGICKNLLSLEYAIANELSEGEYSLIVYDYNEVDYGKRYKKFTFNVGNVSE